jgi:hypothetical protein
MIHPRPTATAIRVPKKELTQYKATRLDGGTRSITKAIKINNYSLDVINS